MDNGLSKFDGQSFKNFNVNDGINGPFVITLSEGLDGSIWTGVHLKMGNIIKNDSISSIEMSYTYSDAKFVHHESGDVLVNENTKTLHRGGNIVGIMKKGDISPSNWTVFYEEDGKTHWKLLNQIESHKDSLSTFRRRTKDFHPSKITLCASKKGEVFIFTPSGILLYDEDSIFRKAAPYFPQAEITAFEEDPNGNYWFLGAEEVFKLDKYKELHRYALPEELHNSIQFKVINEENVFILSDTREHFYKANLISNEFEDIIDEFRLQTVISFIEKDNEGNIWISTMGDGIFCLFNHNFKNFSARELSNVYINSIREAPNGDILICTLKGLNQLRDGKLKIPDWYQKLYNKKTEVFDIFPLLNGEFLISTDSTFSDLIDPKSLKKIRYHDSAPKRFHTYDSDSLILITFDTKKQERIFTYFDLNSHSSRNEPVLGMPKFLMIHIIAYPTQDHNGYWIGSQTGISLLQNGKISLIQLPNELVQARLFDIREDNLGNTWFATGKGILRHNGDKMEYISQLYNWPEFSCRQLIFDKNNNVYMASPEGLYFWDGKTLIKYGIFDGIISNDIRTLLIDSKENLWIGTSSGVSSIAVDKFPLKSNPPKVKLGEIMLDQEIVNQDYIKQIKQDQKLSFSYFMLPYTDQEKLTFSYQLLPDTNWQLTPNRSLEFSKLEYGSYQLNVKAKKSNSAWSEILSIPFEVQPPWWKSIWAYTIFTFLIMGLGLFLSYLWIKNEKRKNKRAYEMAQLKLQVLQSQLNPHFIFNALNVIQGYILENDIDSSNTYLERFSSLMRGFLESSKKNEILLSKEIELLNLFVEMEQLCYEGRFDYELYLGENLRLNSLLIPSMLIQPFVENAIHHGLLKKKGKGKLEIHFKEVENYLFCTIIDDGIGRAKSQELQAKSTLTHISRGMQIVSERLQMQNYLEHENISIHVSDVELGSEKQTGTKVEILCPIKLLDTSSV